MITAEISTVNRKQLDVNLSLPREWQAFEPRIIGHLRKQMSRGAVKVSLTIQPLKATNMTDTAKAYLQQLQCLATELQISGEWTRSDLLSLPPDLMTPTLPAPTDEMLQEVLYAIDDALVHLTTMRQHEGAQMANDLRQRFQKLQGLSDQIQQLSAQTPKDYQVALKEHIDAMLPEGIVLDEATLAREVAVFAERCDIAEELTRLKAHFVHAETLMSGEAPCGRPLDFLCQEFFREINTTGSKCNNGAIAHLVIEFKTLLETVREQVQNIE